MKVHLTAAALLMLATAPAVAQTAPPSNPPVDANGVSVTDQTRTTTRVRSADMSAPHGRARHAPRRLGHKAKGAPGGGGLPANGLGAGSGGPGSKPNTPIQSH